MARNAPEPLTEGPILRALLSLAVPVVFANVLQSVYQLTDTFWVGRLGPIAVAAVSISFPILFLLVAMGGGLSVAGAILVAQAHGGRVPDRVDHVAAQSLLALVGVSVLLAVAGYLLTPSMVGLLSPEPAVSRPAVAYLRISFLGLVFVFGYFVFQSLLRGIGDVRTPLVIVGASVLVNFVMDPLFILGWGPIPEMGVAGAAVATIASQGLAGVVGIGLLFSGRYGIHLRARHLRPDTALMARIFRLGLPSSAEQSSRALGFAVMTLLVTGFGTTAVASYGIGIRILSFVVIPALGLSLATSTVVGQNVGAGAYDRAERTAWTAAGLAFGVLTGAGVLLFLFATPITRAFIPDSEPVVAMGATFIRIIALFFGFLGVQQVLTGAFSGAGRTVVSMILAIVALWVIRFPLAFVLSERTPLAELGIWWAFPVSNVLGALIAVAWFRTGTWKRLAAGEDDELARTVARETLADEGIEGG